MSSLALTDAKILIAGHDLSGQMNAVSLQYGADMLDGTTFGQTTRVNTAGLKSVVASAEGFWDSSATTAVDPVLFSRVGTFESGTSPVPVVVVPQGGTVGNVAYLFRVVHSEYAINGAVGDLLGFTVNMEGAGGQELIRGKLFHNASASGNVTGTAIQLGAVSSTQYVYAALHVFSGSGSFVVKVQSASDQAFTSPNDRITFTTVATGTAVASEWPTRVAGSISDTWWRITATNPATRNFAVAVGIQ